jgi:hypothetical protein
MCRWLDGWPTLPRWTTGSATDVETSAGGSARPGAAAGANRLGARSRWVSRVAKIGWVRRGDGRISCPVGGGITGASATAPLVGARRSADPARLHPAPAPVRLPSPHRAPASVPGHHLRDSRRPEPVVAAWEFLHRCSAAGHGSGPRGDQAHRPRAKDRIAKVPRQSGGHGHPCNSRSATDPARPRGAFDATPGALPPPP